MNSDKVILLVEDNPDDEVLTLRALKKNNILNKVVVAHDGEEALDYLYGRGKYQGRDIRQQPQLILLDLHLPKLSGLEVLEHLRKDERTKLQPVVILTTSNDQNDIIASYENGANSYTRKPVNFNEFVETVRQLGLYWLMFNEPPPMMSARY
jgi:two-component system response regulator